MQSQGYNVLSLFTQTPSTVTLPSDGVRLADDVIVVSKQLCSPGGDATDSYLYLARLAWKSYVSVSFRSSGAKCQKTDSALGFCIRIIIDTSFCFVRWLDVSPLS